MSNQIVQLTDKDNNNIFPVAGSMAGNSIETGMIKDGAVTSSKIDWTTYYYKPGDTIELVDESFMINAIQKVYSDNNFIQGSLQLAKSISSSVTSVTFTPAPGSYQDAYRADGVIFSTDQLTGYTFTCLKHVGNNFASIDIRCDVPAAVSLTNNNLACLRLIGTISFS